VVVSYNVLGSTDPKLYLRDRLAAIAEAVVKCASPDVICLQEASPAVVDCILTVAPHCKHVWSKKDTTLDKKAQEAMDAEGCLVIMSRWPIIAAKLVHQGGYYDDGIVKVTLASSSSDSPTAAADWLRRNLVVYNVHLSGGTFGRPPEVVRAKREGRVRELKSLCDEMTETSSPDDLVVLCGDFNADNSDVAHYTELCGSPEYVFDYMQDAWNVLYRHDADVSGATEDEFKNTFRAALKIKSQECRRRARYDKVLFNSKALRAKAIRVIGNERIGAERVPVIGKNRQKQKIVSRTFLFPSDHFGLSAEFEVPR